MVMSRTVVLAHMVTVMAWLTWSLPRSCARAQPPSAPAQAAEGGCQLPSCTVARKHMLVLGPSDTGMPGVVASGLLGRLAGKLAPAHAPQTCTTGSGFSPSKTATGGGVGAAQAPSSLHRLSPRNRNCTQGAPRAGRR